MLHEGTVVHTRSLTMLHLGTGTEEHFCVEMTEQTCSSFHVHWRSDVGTHSVLKEGKLVKLT